MKNLFYRFYTLLTPKAQGDAGSERLRHAGPALELRATTRSLPHMTNL